MTRFTPSLALIVTVFAATGLLASPKTAPGATALESQAVRLIAVDHHAFLEAKATAPPPFDWSTDGCTSTPPSWALTFDGPCQQHDFGYRNLGHGLRLRPTRAARAWVDGRFLRELRRVCAERFTELAAVKCRAQARAMHAAVRLFNAPWS